MILISGDWHFGDKRILKHRPQFGSVAYHDEIVTKNIISKCNKRTTLYVLGDAAITVDGLPYIGRIRDVVQRLILIPGNHCTENLGMKTLVDYFDEVHGTKSKFGAWLTHQPIHADHLRLRLCIHAHLHHAFIPDPRFFCASLEQNNYMPFDLEDIRDAFLKRIKDGHLDKMYLEKIKRSLP